jgi:hypothetical protein
MNDIKLEELPKSKEFMKHVKIADGLTKETGLEHGFRFCKRNNKIIVDRMCVGDKCSMLVEHEKCKIRDNSFHTHPKRNLSEFSVPDVRGVIGDSFSNFEPIISCVKGEKSTIINCIQYDLDVKDFDKIQAIDHLVEKYKKNRLFTNANKTIDSICKTLMPKHKTFSIVNNKFKKE